LKFRDEVFHLYFENPRYLELVKTKFGNDVLAHIEEMTKIRLKRKIVEEAEKAGEVEFVLPEMPKITV
jgi:dephospho-CoA kinase